MATKPNSRAYNRRMSYLKARRKQRIDKELSGDNSWPPYYNNLHQYSKNKIHCSCPMCATKTRVNGYTMQDLRRARSMDSSEQDYLHNAAEEEIAYLYEDFQYAYDSFYDEIWQEYLKKGEDE